MASFFSIIYAYSRQLFALSRAGYLPAALSVTGKRKTPYLALIVPGAIGFVLAAVTEDGALLINIAVFGATVSYVLMMVSHIVLRRREPDLERPYRTPGGTVTTGVALVLAVCAVVATFFVDIRPPASPPRLRRCAGVLLVLQPPPPGRHRPGGGVRRGRGGREGPAVTGSDEGRRPGLLTLEQLRALVDDGSIDTVVVAMTDMQGRLQGKRCDAEYFLDQVLDHGTEACNYLLAVDVDMNTVDGLRACRRGRAGYGDFVLRPDLATLRRLPWHEGTALVLCDVDGSDGSPVVAVARARCCAASSTGWPSSG